MKTLKSIRSKTIGMLLLAIFPLLIFRCSQDNSRDALEVLRRIPQNNKLIVSFRPAETFRSNFFQSLSSQDRKELREIFRAERRLRSKTGINVIDDIERIIIMSSDLRNLENSWCVLVQGNMSEFFMDSLCAEKEIECDSLTMRGWTAYKVSIHKRTKHLDVYLYHDDEEILLASKEELMDDMLDIKRSGGNTLEDSDSFIREFRTLPFTRNAWGMIDVGEIIDDVLKKVNQKKPDLRIAKLEITRIQGGMYVNDKLGISINTQCPNPEQARLLHDAAIGMLAFGKLTFGSIPAIRQILDKVEISHAENGISIISNISIEEVKALQELATARHP